MQHDNSTKLCKTEIEREMDMAVVSNVMEVARELAEYLEEVHDAAFCGELSSSEVEFWETVRTELVQTINRSYGLTG
jgi:hypothetical protein